MVTARAQKQTNGVTLWIRVGLAIAVIVVAAVIFVVTVQSQANANCAALERHDDRMEKIETQQKEIGEVIHRMDKRQVIIMHKLGASDVHDPD